MDDIEQLIFAYVGNPYVNDEFKMKICHEANCWQIRMKYGCVRYMNYKRLRSGAFHLIKVIETDTRIMYQSKHISRNRTHEFLMFWTSY